MLPRVAAWRRGVSRGSIGPWEHGARAARPWTIVAVVMLALACTGAATVTLGTLPLTLALPVVVFLAAPWGLLAIGMLPLPVHLDGGRLFTVFVFLFALYFLWPQGAFIASLKLPVKHPQKIAFLLFFLVWFFAVFKVASIRQRLLERAAMAKPLIAAVAAVITLSLLSCSTSIAPLFSLYRWAQETVWVVSIFFIALSLPRTLTQVHAALAALSCAALLNAAFALPETLRRKNLFERFNNLEAIDPVTAQAILEAKFRGGGYRAQATFDHPLLFAEFMLVVAPLACVVFVMAFRRWKPVLVLAPLYLFGVLSTRSRVTLVVAGITLLFALIAWLVRLLRQSQRNLVPLIQTVFALPALLAMLAAAAFLGSELVAGRNTDEFLSSLARLEMLRESWPLIQAEPWLGYGHGAGGFVLGFADSSGMMTLDNYFLAVVLDNGMPTLIALLAALLLSFRKALGMVTASDAQVRRLGLAFAASLLTVILIKLVLGTGLNNGLMYLLMALPYVVSHIVEPTRSRKAEGGRHAIANGTDDAVLHHA